MWRVVAYCRGVAKVAGQTEGAWGRALPGVGTLVVKIGSAVLAPEGRLDEGRVRGLAEQLARVHGVGVEVVVVSSGAVASGFGVLGFARPPRGIAQKQASAAVGQPLLMAAWGAAFAAHGIATAQALYTAEDLDKRPRYLNTRRTLGELLARRVVPIVNENDTTSFAEIKVGDNDRLSALTADLVNADLLLILSTARGLYAHGNPRHVLAEVDPEDDLSEHVRPDKSATGVGGIATKIEAARMAARWGIPTIVAPGQESDVVARVLRGEVIGSLFAARVGRTTARKRWLLGAARSSGSITVDEGAARAITTRDASLLPGGITGVDGGFARDATVDIRMAGGGVIARGVAVYSAEEVRQIAGKRASEIEKILGYTYADEVVHRSDLVLTQRPAGQGGRVG